jgi:CelD/BcsL family acetyltransferase involved in cellulose biosynthesis
VAPQAAGRRLRVSDAARAVVCQPLLEALRLGSAPWDRLLERSPAASPFASWAWHRAWAHSAPPEDLAASHAVLVQGAGGTVEALLPVAVRRVTFRRREVTALTWAIGELGCPDHLDVLASPEADLAAVVPTLKALPWDVVFLNNLAADAPNARQLAAALARHGCAVRHETRWTSPYLELPGSWDEYQASLSSGRRQTLRRTERLLRRDHAVVVTDYGTDRLEEGWRHLVALHEQRWAGAGTFSDPQVDHLHRCFTRELARRQQLWLSTLDVDGEPAAAWYGFADRDTVYFYQSGRDPRWAHQSVGVVLMALMIRRAIERGFRRFDFLRGEEAYKAQWTGSQRDTVGLVAFRPTWRGQWLRGLDLAGRLRARLLARNPSERVRSEPAHV